MNAGIDPSESPGPARRPRSWGEWTEIKLDALESYLPAFNRASQRARGTMYLDLFAGTTENLSRASGRRISGSARRALAAEPSFQRVVLCEKDPSRARALRDGLQARPGTKVDVLEGDCNVAVPAYLDDLAAREPGWRRAPIFAFVDQFSADVTWSTLEYLAHYRTGRWKTELWMYFGESFIQRGLGQKTPQDLARYEARVDAMFGTDDWRLIHGGRKLSILDGGQERDELVNLMRWRLEHDLGYQTTIPLRMTRPTGHGLYTMIFATDHDAGSAIMGSVLRGAEEALQAMTAKHEAQQRLARSERRAGGTSAFAGFEDLLNHPTPTNRTHLIAQPPRPPWPSVDDLR